MNDVLPQFDGIGNEGLLEKEIHLTDEQRAQVVEGSLGSIIAKHYNDVVDKGLKDRYQSKIFYLRNFNNWIKSMLINDYLTRIKETKRHDDKIKVLDIGSGKGGDLIKWKKGHIHHLICADISEVAVKDCENRYDDLLKRTRQERNSVSLYTAEFIVADCTKTRIRGKFKDPTIKLDLSSCQFAFHYCFESISQAECLLRNVSECLKVGGYFIGTTPNSNEIINRLRKSDSNRFGNSLYSIEFADDFDIDNVPLFGCQYKFHLEGVVDCPEFLVHFPTLVRLAKKFDLELDFKGTFGECYEKYKEEGKGLLGYMQALETYPTSHGASLSGSDPSDYLHAEQFLGDISKEPEADAESNRNRPILGTISRSEWDAISLYISFCFRKVSPDQRREEASRTEKIAESTAVSPSGSGQLKRKSNESSSDSDNESDSHHKQQKRS